VVPVIRSRRRVAAFLALGLATGFCVLLELARIHYSGTRHHDYLIWNLFLAWLPFLFALALYDADRRGASRLLRGGLAAAWLLFFPNAPYVVTDLIHLRLLPPVPILFDAILLGASAWTGLALGIGSLLLVHRVARRRIGEWTSWALMTPVLALASLGIYLGREVRLNSWDALTQPGHVARVIATPLRDPHAHPRFFVLTLLLTVFLMVTYLVVYTVAELRLEPEDSARRKRRTV
jgi:uncharacterized membrane protein